MTRHAATFATLAISAAGVALFALLHLPLPFLLGPMFACLVAALLGVSLSQFKLLGDTMRTVLGVAVGASITPDLVGHLGNMAVTLSLILPFTLVIAVVGVPYFHRLWGFDKATSYFAAMPGGLQDMLVFGQEAGASPRVLSLVHATRVLVIVSALPMLFAYVLDRDLNRPPGEPLSTLPWHEAVIMVVIAIAGWRLAKRVGLFGATILGPMILAIIASLTDIIHHRPPAEAITAAQFFIGMGVGVTYVGISFAELRRVVAAALGFVIVLAVISAAMIGLIVALGLMPPVEAILAFSPGGQAEMAVLALVIGADVPLVVAHHLVRIVLVIIGAPLLRRYFS